MTVQIEEATRSQVAVFLPKAIDKAFRSYSTFVGEGPEYNAPVIVEDSRTKPPSRDKIFTGHHNACKVALAHVQLLLKLAEWANVRVENDSEMQKTLEMAQIEVEINRASDLPDIGEEG